ncbi:MAG: VCBS repeat-containing protein, partial [Pyrinomonadaceae bacterium]
GAGATNPQPPTNLTAAFSGVPTSNGTWTLRVTDGGGGDTGAVSAATLTLTGGSGVAADAPVDFNGDGKSDYAVVRNTGGGPMGQITWFILNNGGSPSGAAWGIATDYFLPEDYDGDLKDDFAVWRPGPATVATWYILQSNGNTVRAEPFGQSGDDPTVVGDYNNDGKADLAVYRPGALAGNPSFWYYRTAPAGPVTVVGWGQQGDFPAPGDYDGDGSNDFVIQRNGGGGNAAFWRNLTTAPDDTIIFGTPTDVIVPGDYDGDGKTDIATIRGVSGAILWAYDPSSIAGTQSVAAFWGNSATDFPTQGDYDGDGKTDFAIWRPNADPSQNFFWSRNSGNGATTVVAWGLNGDYPVANYNSH